MSIIPFPVKEQATADPYKAAHQEAGNVSALLAAELLGNIKHRLADMEDPYEDCKLRIWRELCPLIERTFKSAQAESNRTLRAALQKAVDMYGKPGGPWNVPSEPGLWLADAQDALKMSEPK